MSQFKVGDRVVNTIDWRVMTVRFVRSDGWVSEHENGFPPVWNPRFLILEAIYNSPLYKALL